jgi:hypothetical protein
MAVQSMVAALAVAVLAVPAVVLAVLDTTLVE